MKNSHENQNAEMAQRLKYEREKEKADKVLARYGVLMKLGLGFTGGLLGTLALVFIGVGNFALGIVFAVVCIALSIVIYIAIRNAREKHRAKLDAQMLNNLSK